jgi:hypothetical protein
MKGYEPNIFLYDLGVKINLTPTVMFIAVCENIIVILIKEFSETVWPLDIQMLMWQAESNQLLGLELHFVPCSPRWLDLELMCTVSA